jgi:hypothetical protein
MDKLPYIEYDNDQDIMGGNKNKKHCRSANKGCIANSIKREKLNSN